MVGGGGGRGGQGGGGEEKSRVGLAEAELLDRDGELEGWEVLSQVVVEGGEVDWRTASGVISMGPRRSRGACQW